MNQSATQHRGPNLSRILTYAAVGAVVLFVGDLLLDVLITVIDGGEIELADMLKGRIPGLASNIGLLGGAFLVFQFGGSKTGLLQGAGIAYAGWVLASLLFVVLHEFASFEITSLLYDLYGPLLMVAFAVVVRTYNGQTVLPGVNVRL